MTSDTPDDSGNSLVPSSLSTSTVPRREKESESASAVDQSASSAGGDIVGRDKTTIILSQAGPTPKIISQLMEKLQHEIRTDQKVRDIITSLQLFYLRKSDDGVVGLVPKLTKGGRESETLFALEKKEQFAKLLDHWSLYASAQEIFAYLLAKAEHRFSIEIKPKIKTTPQEEIDKLIATNIIEPLIDECGVGVFNLNHSIAMGMLYWLAEMCFVRWH